MEQLYTLTAHLGKIKKHHIMEFHGPDPEEVYSDPDLLKTIVLYSFTVLRHFIQYLHENELSLYG